MPAIHVSRSIHINAAPDVVYDSVRDFKQWPHWSPWLIAEPNCPVQHAEDGKSYSWEGDVIGHGSLSIVKEDKPSQIDLDLIFVKPWKSQADVKMTFAPEGEGTTVTWSMNSKLPIFLFFMKNMMVCGISMDYERGLAMLKDYLETGSVPSSVETGQASFPSTMIAGINTTCSVDSIGETMAADFAKLRDWIESSGVEPAGKPISIYHRWDIAKRETEYTTGIPVASADLELPPEMVTREIPNLEAFSITHTGAYRHLGNAWATGMMFARAKKFRQQRGVHPFEVYETEPGTVPDEELVTVVHFPVKG